MTRLALVASGAVVIGLLLLMIKLIGAPRYDDSDGFRTWAVAALLIMGYLVLVLATIALLGTAIAGNATWLTSHSGYSGGGD